MKSRLLTAEMGRGGGWKRSRHGGQRDAIDDSQKNIVRGRPSSHGLCRSPLRVVRRSAMRYRSVQCRWNIVPTAVSADRAGRWPLAHPRGGADLADCVTVCTFACRLDCNDVHVSLKCTAGCVGGAYVQLFAVMLTRTRLARTRTRTRTRTSLTVTYCKLQLNLQSLSSNNNEHKVKVHNIWL